MRLWAVRHHCRRRNGHAVAGLQHALPGGPITRGLAFGLMAWFFRVAMGVAAQAVMFNVPGSALTYALFAGLIEMGVLGALYGIALRSV